MPKRPTEKQLAAARAILERDMAFAEQEQCEELALMVGKCFRTRNNFSNGPSWWKYFRVDRVDGHTLRGTTFEETIDPTQFEVCFDAYMNHLRPDHGYEEISLAAFRVVLGGFMARLKKRLDP